MFLGHKSAYTTDTWQGKMQADLVAKRRVYERDISQSQQDLVRTFEHSNMNDASPERGGERSEFTHDPGNHLYLTSIPNLPSPNTSW